MSNNISVQNLLESFKHLGYANGGIENFINSEMVRNIDLADSSSIDKLFESYLGLFSEYSQQDPIAIYTLIFLVDNFNPNSANLDPYLKVITKDLDWHINYLSNNFNTSSKMSDIRKGILLFVEKNNKYFDDENHQLFKKLLMRLCDVDQNEYIKIVTPCVIAKMF